MATKIETAFRSLGELNLWFGIKTGRPLNLADIPEIIPLRWNYFRDNWEFIYQSLVRKIDAYILPDQLKRQIDALGVFISLQRNNSNTNVNPFSNSSVYSKYYSVWQNIDIANIPITRQESEIVQNKTNTVSRYIKTDFLRLRKDLYAARDEIADTIGLKDETYNTIYSRTSVRTLRTPRISDITNIQTFQEGIRTLDYILANIGGLSTIKIDPFAIARTNANNPDINIPTGNSGSYVKMFYGESLESLAYRFLGSEERWIEIAIANGLKAPYIDEIGEAILLIVNGNGNQINISGLDFQGKKNIEKLYINQVVFLQSSTVKFPDQRKILSIREVPVSGEIIIQLDGDEPLDGYLVSEGAYIRVFKPNTINSNFFVLIPSPDPVSNRLPTHNTPIAMASKEDDKLIGIDLAIGRDNDLVFTSNGDLQASFGLSNALQAMQLKLQNEQGQNPKHPTFGLPSVIGSSQNKDDIRDAIVVSINDMVAADPRFDRIESIDVKMNKQNRGMNVATISLVVRMAGSNTLVPIGFNVNTG